MNRIAFEHKKECFKPWRIASAWGLPLLLLVGQSAPVSGNPTGGSVVAGHATIGSAGTTLTINQSTQNAIINWQQFSIASGELTKFLVPNSSSATLNRVTGGNPSAIYGTLQSNGILYLLNPNGIVVGPSGRIDTASFLASTLDVSNEQFLKGGNLNFAGDSDASVDNEGTIQASSGGVYLIANQVNNNGAISAPQGDVGLAAGAEVLFQQAGDQHLFVEASPAGTTRATGVTNAGTIRAAAAELKAAGGNAYALAINNTGAIAATGYKKVNGQVYLTADGGNITNSGQISAQNPNGGGGTVVVNGHGTTGATTGTVINSGSITAQGTAPGTTGGTVALLGDQVGITGDGLVNVSGEAGGGTALIGGGEHGADASVPDAEQTYLGPDATIVADALTLGTGGKVILWGNETTQAYGLISVTGGAQGGNGGFVETSGATLDAETAPDLSAPHGLGGTWLLDPAEVDITDVGGAGTITSPFVVTTGTSTINQSAVLSALHSAGSGTVTIEATGTPNSNTDTGTILWTQPNSTQFDISTLTGAPTLNLDASTVVGLSGVTIYSSNGSGSLNLTLNDSSYTTPGQVNVFDSNIALNGGNFTAYGKGLTASSSTTDLDGIDIPGSIINTGATSGVNGNIYLNGQAGYSASSVAGIGVFVNGSTLETNSDTNETSSTASLTIIGTSGFNVSVNGDLEGVEIEGSTLSTVNGLLTINGTVSAGTANGTLVSNEGGSYIQGGDIFGVVAGDGTTIESTGNGSVSITGNISPSATSATLDSIGVALFGGVEYTTGEANGGISFPDEPVTTSVTAAGCSGSGTPGITITGTSGTINHSLAGTDIQTPDTAGLLIQSGVSIVGCNVATITLMGTGGIDANTTAADLENEHSEGIAIEAANNGDGSAPNVKIKSDLGDISLTGIAGSSIGSVNGIDVDSEDGDSACITSCAGNISLIGSVPDQTATQTVSGSDKGGVTGVNIAGDESSGAVSSITASAGSIYINGTVSSGKSNSKEAGVVIDEGSQVFAWSNDDSESGDILPAVAETGTGTGDVTIVGNTTGSTALALNAGVFINGANTTVSATGTEADAYGGTGLTITGISGKIDGKTGTTVDQHGDGTGGAYFAPVTAGIAIANGATIETHGCAPMTLTGTGGTDSNSNSASISADVILLSLSSDQTTSISGGYGAITITGLSTSSSNPARNFGVVIGGPSNDDGNASITSCGAVTILDTGADIIFGPGGSIVDSGTCSGDNVVLAAGNGVGKSFYYILNYSTVAGGAIQVSGDNSFYLYSSDPTYDVFGGLAASVPSDNVFYHATYPASNLGSVIGNAEFFYVDKAGDVGPNAPKGSSSGGGSGDKLAAIVPQPTPTGAPLPGSGTDETTFEFDGSGESGLIGSQDGGLANSSSNSGQVGSGDAAQLNGGGLNNVSNPQASGALNLALSPFVQQSLANALGSWGDWGGADVPGSGGSDVGDQETILNGGDVVEIGDNVVKNIPLSKAPKPLQDAMGHNGLNGVPSGTGH